MTTNAMPQLALPPLPAVGDTGSLLGGVALPEVGALPDVGSIAAVPDTGSLLGSLPDLASVVGLPIPTLMDLLGTTIERINDQFGTMADQIASAGPNLDQALVENAMSTLLNAQREATFAEGLLEIIRDSLGTATGGVDPATITKTLDAQTGSLGLVKTVLEIVVPLLEGLLEILKGADVPAVTQPAITMPTVAGGSTPAVSVPGESTAASVSAPTVTDPAMSVPVESTAPSVSAPAVTDPAMSVPGLPGVTPPVMSVPAVPEVTLPALPAPSVSAPALPSVPINIATTLGDAVARIQAAIAGLTEVNTGLESMITSLTSGVAVPDMSQVASVPAVAPTLPAAPVPSDAPAVPAVPVETEVAVAPTAPAVP